MKTKLIRSVILSLAALGTLALVSCQAPKHHVPSSAISCTKCATVYFKSPTVTSAAGDKGFVTLRSASSMNCPGCENKVIAWAKKGEFTEHTCKTCGGTMHHCTNH